MQLESSIKDYLQRTGYSKINLKTVLFDMDGVLFNSMPYHADAWHVVMERYGLHLSLEEAYLNEGRTGAATINIVYQRQFGCDASQNLIDALYKEKSEEFHLHGEVLPMPGAAALLDKLKQQGILPVLVTGSGQVKLIARLNHYFPGSFQQDRMVTALDVKYGKPNPEPYLMGLQKGHVAANEAIVVENAPIGVEAGHKAGVFTVAVNTGPIDDQRLLDAGADILFHSMQELCDNWERLKSLM